MALDALQEQIREMMQCKICFEDKENQKQLPCQHTLCLQCLNSLKLEDSRYKCPLCQRDNFVPNGGFEALPESLITRQLASLIHAREWAVGKTDPLIDSSEKTEPEATTTTPDGVNSANLQQTEAKRKLNFGIKKGKETLELAEEKVKAYSTLESDLTKNEEDMIAKIQSMMEESITELQTRVSKKVEAVKEITKSKQEEISIKLSELKTAYEEAGKSIDQLKENAAALESESSDDPSNAVEHVDEDMQRAQTVVQTLKDSLLTTSSDNGGGGGQFKVGDSVRLKLDLSLLKPSFIEKDLTHSSIGYIHEINNSGDCAVIFPGSSAWVGNTRTLDKSAINHDLPVVGDRVRVKPSITEPHFSWGKCKAGSIGILKELKNRGPREGREVSVEFPEDDTWKGIFDELEKVPAEPLKVGDEVWIAKDVSEPARGWAGVSSTSVGTLLSVNGEDVLVHFPECEQWMGLLSEIERTRPIMVGDKVRVMKSVKEPKTGWAGISHSDEGVVKQIKDHTEYGKVAGIDFPNRIGLWNCLLAELELVNRHTPSAAGGRGIQINAHHAMQAMQSVNEQLMSDLSKQQCHTQ